MQKVPHSFTIGDVFVALRRYFFLVLILTLAFGGGAYFVATQLPETYSATARLISDASRAGFITINEDAADEVGDATATSTMVEIIGTPVVLNHALEAMSPELLALLDEAAYPPDEPRETEPPEEERRKGLLRNLGQNLDPSNSGRSFV